MELRENALRDVLNQVRQDALTAVPRPVVYLAPIGTSLAHRDIASYRYHVAWGLHIGSINLHPVVAGLGSTDCWQGSTTVASYNHTATLAPITPDPDDPVEPASTSA